MLSVPNSPKSGLDRILKEGWIHKKSAHVHKYRKRYMVLKANLSLTCYKSDDKKVPTEIFDLSKRHRVESHRSVKEKFYLMELSNPKKSKKRTFKAQNEKDRNEWVAQIKYAIVTGTDMIKIKKDAKIKDLSHKRMSMKVPTTPPNFPTFESTQSIFSETLNENDGMRGPMSASATYVYIAVKPSDFRNFRIRSVTVDRNPFLDDLDLDNHSSDNSNLDILNNFDTENDEKMDIQSIIDMDAMEDDFDSDVDKDEDIQKALENINKMTQNFASYMETQSSANNPLLSIKDPIVEKQKLERIYVENEFIESEEKYSIQLDVLLNELLVPCSLYVDKTKYTKMLYKDMTSTLPQILSFHEHMELSLATKDIGDVLKEWILKKEDFVSMYDEYLSGFKQIIHLFAVTFIGNEAVAKHLRMKRVQEKPLSNFLVLPMQRIAAYDKLLHRLLQNTQQNEAEYDVIVNVLKFVQNINDKIEQNKAEIDAISQCFQIQESLKGLKHSIVDIENANKRMFKSQFIFLLKRESQQRQFFVFNDVMIVANTHWIVKNVVDIKDVQMQFDGKNVNTNKRRKSQMELYEFTLKWQKNEKPEVFISDDKRQIVLFQQSIVNDIDEDDDELEEEMMID